LNLSKLTFGDISSFSLDAYNFYLAAGDLFITLNKYDSANIYFKKAIEVADSIDFTNGLSIGYYKLLISSLFKAFSFGLTIYGMFK